MYVIIREKLLIALEKLFYLFFVIIKTFLQCV